MAARAAGRSRRGTSTSAELCGRPVSGPASRLLRIAGAAFAAIALAGCGGDGEELTKAEYEQKVRSVYAEVQTAFEATRVQSQADLPDRVEAAQDALRDAADELDDVEPPAEVAADNDRLVAGMRGYADELDAVQEAAEEGDAQAVEELSRALARGEALEEMAEAAEAMKGKGYDLGPLAEE